jgi:glycosyltransferase involved in cell wall biosynthesis
MQKLPFISCIMPTKDRSAFALHAIEYFLRQDYPNKELVILDDGADAIQDIVPDDPRFRYLGLERKYSLGGKRNLACEAARGEIILHWDDDDWHADWRISYQVNALLDSGADICGLDQVYFYNPDMSQAWQYCYPDSAKPWVYGGTLCYFKAFWLGNPFANVAVGEDNRFVWSDQEKRILPLEKNTFYVAIIHPGNTSPKKKKGNRWQPVDAKFIQNIMG